MKTTKSALTVTPFFFRLANVQSLRRTGIAQSVKRLATGWTVRRSNPGRGEIFRTRPDRIWGPPSLLYNGYWVSFPGVKQSGRGVDHTPTSSAEVKERLELYLYSPSGPSRPVHGWTLPLPLPSVLNKQCVAGLTEDIGISGLYMTVNTVTF